MSKCQKQLKHLPKSIQVKVVTIIREIAQGTPLSELRAKRLQCCKNNTHVISAPVGNRYRLLIKKIEGALQPYWVGSHEAYNTKITQI